MEDILACDVENRVQKYTTNNRLGTAYVRANCLRYGQVGIGLRQAMYLFTKKEHIICIRPIAMALFPFIRGFALPFYSVMLAVLRPARREEDVLAWPLRGHASTHTPSQGPALQG